MSSEVCLVADTPGRVILVFDAPLPRPEPRVLRARSASSQAPVVVCVVAADPGDLACCVGVLAAGNCEVGPRENVAGEPGVDVGATRPVELRVEAAATAATPGGRPAPVKTVAISGTPGALLAQCVKHAREREQFGRPHSRFQTVKEMLAQLAGKAALVRAAVALLGGLAESFAVASAKTPASEAVGRSCMATHQVHAAVRFAGNYVRSRPTRRPWATARSQRIPEMLRERAAAATGG